MCARKLSIFGSNYSGAIVRLNDGIDRSGKDNANWNAFDYKRRNYIESDNVI